jgi:hypothetical protein
MTWGSSRSTNSVVAFHDESLTLTTSEFEKNIHKRQQQLSYQVAKNFCFYRDDLLRFKRPTVSTDTSTSLNVLLLYMEKTLEFSTLVILKTSTFLVLLSTKVVEY